MVQTESYLIPILCVVVSAVPRLSSCAKTAALLIKNKNGSITITGYSEPEQKA